MSPTYRGLRIWLRPKSRLFEIFSQKFFCQNENVTEVQKKLFVDKHFRSSFQIFDFGLWSRNGILNKNSHKIAPLLWMISKVTQRVKLSLNLLINGFRWRFPIMGSKISPRISWANLNLKIYVPFYMAHIIWSNSNGSCHMANRRQTKARQKTLEAIVSKKNISWPHASVCMHFRIKIFLRYP